MSVRGEQNFLGFNDNPKCSITHLESEGSQPRGPAQGSVPTQVTSRSFLGQRPDPRGESLTTTCCSRGQSPNGSPRGLHLYPGQSWPVVNSGSHWPKAPTTVKPREQRQSVAATLQQPRSPVFIGWVHLPQSYTESFIKIHNFPQMFKTYVILIND